jgi:molecular chaperone GrpE
VLRITTNRLLWVTMETRQSDEEVTAGSESTEVEQLKEQLQHEHEMYLRALADFDNYRRRVARERENAASSAQREIILSVLETLDGFEQALLHLRDAPSAVVEGLNALHRRLLNALERHDVTPIRSVGEAFDPQLHEAIDSIRSDQFEPGTVAEELQRGYRLGDELLRPARVRVAL